MSSVWFSVVVFVFEVGDLGEQRLLRRVEVLDEVDDAALVLEGLVELALGPLVAEDDLEALVEERHRLQALEHGAGDELGALGEEDRWIRPERDRRTGLARQRTAGRGVADDCELALRLAALGVLLLVALAVLVDLDEQPLAEGVDHADADAVETAGDLVAVAAELAAGVEHGEHDLGGALALVRTGGVRIDRNAASVVVDADAAIGHQRDRDARAEARHRLVDSVVDDLPNQVVKPGQTGGPDVHSRSFSDRVETFQNLDVFCRVVGRWFVGVERHAHLNLSAGKARLTCGYVGDKRAGFLRIRRRRNRSPSYRMGVTQRRLCGHLSTVESAPRFDSHVNRIAPDPRHPTHT